MGMRRKKCILMFIHQPVLRVSIIPSGRQVVQRKWECKKPVAAAPGSATLMAQIPSAVCYTERATVSNVLYFICNETCELLDHTKHS